MVDLHDCSFAESWAVMVLLLQELKGGAREVADITVVTGQGKNSEGGPVLLTEVRSLLVGRLPGPAITEVPGNAGRFVLTRESIFQWLLK